MTSWNRLNPLNLLTRSTQSHQTHHEEEDSDMEEDSQDASTPGSNVVPSVTQPHRNPSVFDPNHPIASSSSSSNHVSSTPKPSFKSPASPSKSGLRRSMFKRNQPSPASSSTWSISSPKKGTPVKKQRLLSSLNPQSRLEVAPMPADATTNKMDSYTPLRAKHSASILRGRNTPGTGQSVRFVSKDAYRIISPNISAAEDSTTEGEVPFSATSADFESRTFPEMPSVAFPEDRADDQFHLRDWSEVDDSLRTGGQTPDTRDTPSSTPNPSSQRHPLSAPDFLRQSSLTPTGSGEVVSSNPFARAAPPTPAARLSYGRSPIPAEFFATSSPPPLAVGGANKNLSVGSSPLAPLAFDMSQEMETIPMVDDGTGLMNGSLAIEIPRYSGEIDPAQFFESESQPQLSSMLGNRSAHHSGRNHSSSMNSSAGSANMSVASRAQSSFPQTSTPDGSTYVEAQPHDDTTAFHSIIVNSPAGGEAQFAPAESSSVLMHDTTPERSAPATNATVYFTPGDASQPRASFSSDSFSHDSEGLMSSVGTLPALLTAQEELITDLRNEISFQHDITTQYEADLSARDELVEVLADRVETAEQEAASFRLEGERKEEKLRKLKGKIHQMREACQHYYDELERSREENNNRSVFDAASGQALRALHGQLETLRSEKKALEAKIKDSPGKVQHNTRVADLEKNLHNYTREFESLAKVNDDLTEKLGAERQRLDNLRQASRADMQKLRSACEEEKKKMRLMCDEELKKMRLVCDEELKKIRSACNEEKEEIRRAWEADKDDMETKAMEGNELNRISDDLRGQLDAKGRELETLHDKVDSLTTQLEEADNLINRYESEAESLETELQQSRDRVTELEDENSDLKRLVDELEVDMESLVHERDNLGADRDALAEERGQMELDVVEIVKERDHRIEVAEREQKAREEVVESFSKLSDEHNTLRSEFDLVQERLQSLSQKCDNLNRENEELSTALHTQEREQEALREQHNQLGRDYERTCAQQDRTIKDLEEREAATRKDVEALIQAKAQAAVDKAEFEKKEELLREEVNQSMRRISDLQKESAARGMQIVSLEKLRSRDQDDKEGLNLALETKQQELEMMKRKFGVRGTAGATPAPSRVAEVAKRIPNRESSVGLVTPSIISRPVFRDLNKGQPSVSSTASEDDIDATPIAKPRQSESEDDNYVSKMANGGGRLGPRASMGPLASATASKHVRMALSLDPEGHPLPAISALRTRPRSSLASTTMGTPTPRQPITAAPSSHSHRLSIGSLPFKRPSSTMEKPAPGRSGLLTPSPAPSLEDESADEKENRRPPPLTAPRAGSGKSLSASVSGERKRVSSASKFPIVADFELDAPKILIVKISESILCPCPIAIRFLECAPDVLAQATVGTIAIGRGKYASLKENSLVIDADLRGGPTKTPRALWNASFRGTVYYDEGVAHTPNSNTEADATTPQSFNAIRNLLQQGSASGAAAQQAIAKNLTAGRVKSIIDDLTGRSKAATPVSSPTAEEKANPFLASPRLAAQSSPAGSRSLPSRLPVLQLGPSNIPRIVVPPPSAPNPPPPPPPPPLVRNKSSGGDTLDTGRQTRAPRRLSRTKSRSQSMRRSSSIVDRSPRLGFSDLPHNTPWQIEPSSHGNAGLYNAVNSVGDVIEKKLWVGIIDSPTDDFGEEFKVDLEMKLQEKHESMPVWITDSEFTGCYDVFCHQVLWPTLHYAPPDAPKTRVNLQESKSFDQYASVNRKFADAIISGYQAGDIIMINDYHLMLLPAMIREKIPDAQIGFFLHVTFPSSEIFRCLASREHLLRGMLGADLIGFQTHNHARHFRQTITRLLSLEAVPKGIQLENGFVDVQIVPMGIDLNTLYQKRRDPEVEEWVTNLRLRYAGMKLIVGRDKLDEIQGVKQKLLAFETFLISYPEFLGKVVLIQVALSTTSEVETAAADAINVIISRINSRFSTLSYTPVVLLHTHDLNFNQYLALLTVADAFMITSLREGMALRTHEFIECQEERKRPLILSEFVGIYSYSGFRSCLAVNPYDSRGTAEAIKAALTITDDEAEWRWKDLHNHVVTQTAQAFVTSFLTRIQRAHAEHTQKPLANIPTFPATEVIQNKYRSAKRRLFLLGLESTLVLQDPKVTWDSGFSMPDRVLELLKKLSEDERNVVYLLSGLPVEGALDKVAAALPNVGLVAEDGCFIKPRSDNGQPTEWINMVSSSNMKWKKLCGDLLKYFTERTPGSFIEERAASIRWRYWPGNPDDSELPWARRQAAEAQNHIWDSLGERFGLRIVPATRSFLILPKTASRTGAIAALLKPHAPAAWNEYNLSPSTPVPTISEPFDFVLAVGGDERLLGRINDLPGSETVSTSGKNSDAKYRLSREDAVNSLWEFTK